LILKFSYGFSNWQVSRLKTGFYEKDKKWTSSENQPTGNGHSKLVTGHINKQFAN